MGAVRGFGIVMPVVSVSAETSMAEGGAMMYTGSMYSTPYKSCNHFFVMSRMLNEGEGKGDGWFSDGVFY